MTKVYNLGVKLVAQCENCGHLREFAANLTEPLDKNYYVLEENSVFNALQNLGWQHSRGHWFCKNGLHG